MHVLRAIGGPANGMVHPRFDDHSPAKVADFRANRDRPQQTVVSLRNGRSISSTSDPTRRPLLLTVTGTAITLARSALSGRSAPRV
jgi:hypothetical protein